MKRLLLLIALAGSMALLAGAGGTYKGGTYPFPTASTSSRNWVVPVSSAQAFSVLSRDAKFPNESAADSGYVQADEHYTTINSGAGTGVRWGWVRKDYPTTVYASTSANNDYENWSTPYMEETYQSSWKSTQRWSFLWFSLDGIPAGATIESAHIMFNFMYNITISSGILMCARADTVDSDYSILDGTTIGFYGSNNDTARFDVSWDNTVQQTSTAWNPDLDDRHYYSDFGFGADECWGSGTYPRGTPARIDVTSAVQAVVDSGQDAIDRGVLFLIYGTDGATTGSINFAAGNRSDMGTNYGGNPCMTVEGYK